MIRAISIADLVSSPSDASLVRSVGRLSRSETALAIGCSIGEEDIVSVDMGIWSPPFILLHHAHIRRISGTSAGSQPQILSQTRPQKPAGMVLGRGPETHEWNLGAQCFV